MICIYRKLFPEGWGPIDTGWLLTIAVMVLIESIALPTYCIEQTCSSKLEDFLELKPSEMGDTLAGIFSALVFIWIIVTVFLQRRELSDQRLEFQAMNRTMNAEKFEQMVFEFVRTHNELVSGIEIEITKGMCENFSPRITCLKGRAAFPRIYNTLSREFSSAKETHNDRQSIYLAYKRMWNESGYLLGHYYRFLYNSFKTMSNSEETQAHHIKLMRSQLSDHELLLLLYNCLFPKGQKFVKYAEEFKLFDNLPTQQLLEHYHWTLIPDGFGENEMFDAKAFRKWEVEYLSGLGEAK